MGTREEGRWIVYRVVKEGFSKAETFDQTLGGREAVSVAKEEEQVQMPWEQEWIWWGIAGVEKARGR